MHPSNNLSFIICSAGAGRRMTGISELTPKCLLQVHGHTLLSYSLDSLPVRTGDQIIFLHRMEGAHLERASEILHRFGREHSLKIQLLKLDRLTSGQAETAFLAKDKTEYSRIAIYNTDTYFKSHSLTQALHNHNFDGVAPCYRAAGAQWSFFKTDGIGPYFKTLDVKEKSPISPWCSTGFYYFKSGDTFFNLVEKALSKSRDNELYVAPFYNSYLAEGGDIRVVDCDEFKPMGTPDQVLTYWGLSLENFVKENQNKDY